MKNKDLIQTPYAEKAETKKKRLNLMTMNIKGFS